MVKFGYCQQCGKRDLVGTIGKERKELCAACASVPIGMETDELHIYLENEYIRRSIGNMESIPTDTGS